MVRHKMEKIKAIISNNCWGGEVYKFFEAKYNTPTIGLYFDAQDYIKFLKNFRDILKKEIIFSEHESDNFPVGYIDDVKIYFMHFKDKEEVIEKWRRRLERLPDNDSDILFQISDRDGFSQETLNEFSKIKLKNKIGFVKKGRFNLLNNDIFVEVDCGDEGCCPDGVRLAHRTKENLNIFSFDLSSF